MPKSQGGVRLDTVRSDFGPKFEKIATAVSLRVSDKVKLKTKHRNGTGLASTELESKRWKVSYDFDKKEACGQYEHKFEGFEVKVKQRVPNMNWSVVPSPEVEVETSLIKKADLSDTLELRYDMHKRLAAVEEKLKIGKKHECVVAADTADGLEGASLQWKTKVGKPYVKTVSAKYSRKKGPVLSYTVDPNERLGLKLETALSPKIVKGEATYKPEYAERAEVGVNFQQPFNSADKPRTGFFVKWKFD